MLVDMIGDRLKELRTGAGMNQPEFASIVGTSKQYVSQLESGKNLMPSGEFMEGWARHFDVSPRWLVSGSGSKYAATSAVHHSQTLRLDPDMIAETHRVLRELYEESGRVFSIEEEPERFVQVYQIRAGMSEEPSQDEWIKFGRKLIVLPPQGATKDERDDGVPTQGTGTGKQPGRVRRKA
jgi:transcriptional regulator with XRE-family HTH domain